MIFHLFLMSSANRSALWKFLSNLYLMPFCGRNEGSERGGHRE